MALLHKSAAETVMADSNAQPVDEAAHPRSVEQPIIDGPVTKKGGEKSQHANDITADVQGKIQKIDPIVDSVKNLGDVMNELTLTVKQVSVTVIEKYRKSREEKGKAVPVAKVPLAPPEERTDSSADAVYAKKSSGRMEVALKGVDAAAAIWQKFRK